MQWSLVRGEDSKIFMHGFSNTRKSNTFVEDPKRRTKFKKRKQKQPSIPSVSIDIKYGGVTVTAAKQLSRWPRTKAGRLYILR